MSSPLCGHGGGGRVPSWSLDFTVWFTVFGILPLVAWNRSFWGTVREVGQFWLEHHGQVLHFRGTTFGEGSSECSRGHSKSSFIERKGLVLVNTRKWWRSWGVVSGEWWRRCCVRKTERFSVMTFCPLRGKVNLVSTQLGSNAVWLTGLWDFCC